MPKTVCTPEQALPDTEKTDSASPHTIEAALLSDAPVSTESLYAVPDGTPEVLPNSAPDGTLGIAPDVLPSSTLDITAHDAPTGMSTASADEPFHTYPEAHAQAMSEDESATWLLGNPAEEPHISDPHDATPPDSKMESGDTATAPPPAHKASLPPLPQEPDLIALRELLFRRELALLDNLQQRLNNPLEHAHDLSTVIAEALVLRAQKDKALSVALEPVVDKIFKTSLRKNPVDFVNILFPLMGPSIRRSIAETFRGMMEGFSKSIEMAFSWKGLCWRFEAHRAGKPYSEIVLLHTLVYRVEQVFFIHSETGLVLAHVADEGVNTQDADMVSGMLTAIQDFVRDCFGGELEDELESLQRGAYTIMVEKTPQAYLACVVRGTPPMDFRERLRVSLELMLIEYAEPLANFTGDTAFFTFARKYLEDCLISRFLEEKKPVARWAKIAPFVLFFALVSGLGTWKYFSYEETAQQQAATQKMEQALEHLRQEPGLVVLNAKHEATGLWDITVMQDTLARDPHEIFQTNGIASTRYTLRSMLFVSHETEMVAKRIRNTVQVPEGVTMNFVRNGTLVLAGTAPMHWMLQVRQEALTIPGVISIDMANLKDPRMEKLTQLVQTVESSKIEFGLGKEVPASADMLKLESAVTALVELEKLATKMGIAVGLTIYGHADAVGMPTRNYEISQARARTVAAMLYAKGSSIPVSTYGLGADYADRSVESLQGDQASRRIELKVRLTQAGDVTPDLLKK